MSSVVIENGLVHYEVLGRGRPLVLLHGWLGSWRYWMPAMEDLSRGHRAYALDLWGFGDSDKHRVGYTVGDYVTQLGAFLDQLGVNEVSLVGHALGGVIALEFAIRNRERVGRVVGVGVPFGDAAISRALTTVSGNGDSLAKLVARQANFREIDMEARKTDVTAITGSVTSLGSLDLHEMLRSLHIPVLLVYGEQDALIRWPGPEFLQADMGATRMFCLDGAHHFPMLEQRNKFNRLLMDFLADDGNLASLTVKEEWQRRVR